MSAAEVHSLSRFSDPQIAEEVLKRHERGEAEGRAWIVQWAREVVEAAA